MAEKVPDSRSKPASAERRERLAAELRANLKKRKARMRSADTARPGNDRDKKKPQ